MTDSKTYSYAKLNLRLKITGRRQDGYHLLEMLNVTTGLHDELIVEKSDHRGISLSVEGDEELKLLPVDENLVYRVTESFLKRFDLSHAGINIVLRKNIPAGGGMGGGSSNAAVTLLRLKELFDAERDIQDGDLKTIALQHGTDIVYLLSGGFARVTGIGEVVEPLNGDIIRGTSCLLVFPHIHIPSSVIYQQYREQTAELKTQPGSAFAIEHYEDVLTLIENDLEEVVVRYAPLLGELLAVFREQKDVVAGITGTGSTLFLLPRERTISAEKFLHLFEKRFAAKNISFHLTQLLANT